MMIVDLDHIYFLIISYVPTERKDTRCSVRHLEVNTVKYWSLKETAEDNALRDVKNRLMNRMQAIMSGQLQTDQALLASCYHLHVSVKVTKRCGNYLQPN